MKKSNKNLKKIYNKRKLRVKSFYSLLKWLKIKEILFMIVKSPNRAIKA